MGLTVEKWAIKSGKGHAVAIVGSPSSLRDLAESIRAARDCGPVAVLRDGHDVSASDDADGLLISGSEEALEYLAKTIESVAVAAEMAGPNPAIRRHADLESVTNSWMSDDSLPLEIIGEIDPGHTPSDQLDSN